METTLRISEEMQINEIIRLYPTTVSVFHRFGMDACCGGALPVGEAARRHGLDAEQVLAALAGAVAAEP